MRTLPASACTPRCLGEAPTLPPGAAPTPRIARLQTFLQRKSNKQNAPL